MGDLLSGAWRKPVQMLQEQTYGGGKSLHDDALAEKLGFAAGPIEGPTHFSQFVPLLDELWSKAWFERGCFSAHFQTMVFEGESVQAHVEPISNTKALCRAEKEDGTPVLEASATLGPEHGETLLEARRAKLRPSGDLVILADFSVGMTGTGDEAVRMEPDQHMGNLYPFSLNEKLKAITEPHAYYSDIANGWGKPVIPLEMVSVLGNYSGKTTNWPVKRPSTGLFADLEVRMINGPLLVGETYQLRREIVALNQSRRAENYWVRTRFFDEAGEQLVAEMMLNHGVMKASYPDYPPELLPE